MPDIYYHILTAFGVGLLAILGGFAVQRFNAKKNAGLRLREAFAPELAKLQNPAGRGISGLCSVLETAHEKHRIAVNEFRFFLTGTKLDAFDKAWKDYYTYPDDSDEPDFSKYMMLDEEDIQKTIKEIEAILEFTK